MAVQEARLIKSAVSTQKNPNKTTQKGISMTTPSLTLPRIKFLSVHV